MKHETLLNQPFPHEPQLLSIFERKSGLVICDIGACDGIDSIRYSRLFPNAVVYAFEPVPRNVTLIEENLRRYGCNAVQPVPLALSDRPGSHRMYLSSGQPSWHKRLDEWDYGNKSSSLLPPNRQELRTHWDWLKFDSETTIPATTLDDFCQRQEVKRVDYLHIDVQGAELMVLRGATKILQSVRAVWLEVSSVRLYVGQPLQEDIEDFMTMQGFEKSLHQEEGVQADELYVRATRASSSKVHGL